VHHLSLIEFSIYQAIKARVMNDHPSRTLLASFLIAISLSPPADRASQPVVEQAEAQIPVSLFTSLLSSGWREATDG
jgi:hypothetical protein